MRTKEENIIEIDKDLGFSCDRIKCDTSLENCFSNVGGKKSKFQIHYHAQL